MKKLGIILAVLTMIGCASTRNTINRLQGDIEHFQEALGQYALVMGEGATVEAIEALSKAEEMLSLAMKASKAGDKISEKKYLSALVDIMDLLPEPETEK